MDWRSPAPSPTITDDAIHVWRADVDDHADDFDAMRRVLSPDERERADRFRFDRDRRRFIVRRAMLRDVLSRYLDAPWIGSPYRHNAFGKPALPAAQAPWTFNTSHSRGRALVAVARDRALGVDIEMIRSNIVEEGLAERFFTEGEVRTLRALDRAQQDTAFFDCWTRKEAYIKAQGQGLSIALNRFEVSLGPDDAARLLWTAPDADEAARWSMIDLPVGDQHRGCLAAPAPMGPTTLWKWGGMRLGAT